MKKGRGPKGGRPGGAPRKGPPCGGTIPGGPVKSPGGPPGRKGGLKKAETGKKINSPNPTVEVITPFLGK